MQTTYCPVCRKNVVWLKESTYRPFCSKRCQITDLGAWADGSYSIPSDKKGEDFELPPTMEGQESH